MTTFQPHEDFARQLDACDPLREYRDAFHHPVGPDGRPLVYLCGHSLGLQPRGVQQIVDKDLAAWARLGVEGHFHADTPWYSYPEQVREPGARLVGASPGEVVMMNSLTVNLHLMMATFYRPTKDRFKIMVDAPTFPSDLHAVNSQLRQHGYDPAAGLVVASSRAGEHLLRMEDITTLFERHGRETALVLWNGVNFLSGQFFDLKALTAVAKSHGCMVGLDLAHAAGNVPLSLHAWNVDFAVWCSYKYLNSGPGAVAGCFVHEQHGNNPQLPRLAGWWGTDPATRFAMEDADFVPQPGAAGWQVSNPPILSLAPLRASLALFDQAGMAALRTKSQLLTSFLEFLLDRDGRCEIITPRDPERRGCQLSLRVPGNAQERLTQLKQAGVVCDFRAPDILRVAPAPLYNTFQDVWTFVQCLVAGERQNLAFP
jgi:kynureninase